ncbi:MAG: hypothetical protein Kow0013_06100 [Pararhodobacter sp.]
MDAQFLAELNERLFVHFIQGQWRAPTGARHLPVLPFDGARVGRIVCAEARDVARARAGLGQGAPAPPDRLRAAYEALRGDLAALRRREGAVDPAGPPRAQAVPGEGPMVLLSAAAVPVSTLAGVILAAAGRGVLWKPAPGAAASAHLLVRGLGPLMDGNLALVQGDHATGAAVLAGGGAVVWASDASAPEGVAPVLSLAATDPRHR